MRNADRLTDMRLKGLVPALVYVKTDLGRIVYDRFNPFDPDFVTLEIEASDNPKRLDLRCLVSLTCVVSGCDAQTVDDVTAACVRAKAGRVIANTHERKRGSEFAVVRVTDTEGIFSWQNS